MTRGFLVEVTARGKTCFKGFSRLQGKSDERFAQRSTERLGMVAAAAVHRSWTFGGAPDATLRLPETPLARNRHRVRRELGHGLINAVSL